MNTPTDHQWYLIQCKPREGFRAEEHLTNQGFTCFHPTHRVEKVRRTGRQWVTEPLFPNYLFIQLDTVENNWYPIRSTRGVSKMVTFNNQPLAVPTCVIEGLKHRLEDSPSEQPAFSTGDKVRIKEGCFSELDAIFQAQRGEDRALLLLTLLSTPQRIEVPLHAISRF
ncbi:transcription/translation regulatory transformer protein RfaH [Pokkaliibacter sp. CJK22405]|uniref:transcription/translation regulatory transformer protein RfaH n=1 Tax=Pokkaliibacter sp. CJK22405 TaxID=3384615 RepID=UPI003984B709